jgi:preprotein translocase subunit SecE
MAKGGSVAVTAKEPGFFERIQQFIVDVRTEMRKVNWPPKEEVKSMTQVVMIALLIMAAIVMVYDKIFFFCVQLLLRLG